MSLNATETLSHLRSSLWFLLFILAPFAEPLVSQVDWTASDQNPVFTIGERGSFDSNDMSAMCLLKRENDYVLC